MKVKNLKTYAPDEDIPQADAVVIATSGEYSAIRHALKIQSGVLLTIQDLLNEMEE